VLFGQAAAILRVFDLSFAKYLFFGFSPSIYCCSYIK